MIIHKERAAMKKQPVGDDKIVKPADNSWIVPNNKNKPSIVMLDIKKDWNSVL